MPKNTKLSDVIGSQFPNFVQDDYPTFIAFLEAYYTYLDQQKLTRSLEYIKDIDKTLDEFIGFIRREISPETPQNNKFFMQHAKKAQLARGSEDSYRTLFRFLLKKEINIQYPAEKMLRVSGGQWEQDTSFFLKVSAGDPFKLQNNFLYIECSKKQIFHRHRVYVKKVQRIETTLDVYEVFIAKNFYGLLDVDDTVNYNGVIGVIQPTTSKVKIVNPGSGFKVGQVFNISTSSASGLLVKVAKTDQEGRLKQLQIISFGVGFKKNFYYNITRFQALASSQAISGKNVTQNDVLTDGNDSGVMNKVNYHNGYAEGNYVGDVLADFYTANIPEESEQVVASLLVELGGISRYPGYYKSSNSIIDDDSYIQDGEYYQDFSYVIKIDEKLDTYKDVVLSILHPVGRKLFGEYQIESSFVLNLEISNPVIRILIPQFSESDETVSMFDRTIYQVKDFKFNADGIADRWTLYVDQNPAETVALFVKLNGAPIERYLNWDISGNDLVLSFVPNAGDVITARYAVMSYSGSASLQDTIFDLSKRFTDVASDMTDNGGIRAFSKALLPQFGYIDEAKMANGTGATESDSTDFATKFVSKPLSDEIVSALFTEVLTRSISKPLASSSDLPLTDATIYSFSKSLTGDSFATPDAVVSTKGVSKALADATDGAADLISGKAFGKALADATDGATEDISSISLSKALADVIDATGFTHTTTLTLNKALSDAIDTPLDSAIKTFNKYLADSVTVVDDLGSVILGRNLSDSITVDESLTNLYTDAPVNDTAAATDSSTSLISKNLTDETDTPLDSAIKTFNKYLADSVTVVDDLGSVILGRNLSDSITVDESLTNLYTDAPVNDTAAATDLSTSLISKNLTDETSLNNTGYLQLNPYSSELSYFAEDFMSGRTTFTS